MITKGQLIFAILFFLAFVIGITIAYRKDKNGNTSLFKGSYKILLFVIFVFVLLYGIVKLKHLLVP